MSDRTVTVGLAVAQPRETNGLRVTLVAGPDAGRTQSFAQSRVLVGRAETADVRLRDPTVSQFHAEITATPGGVFVTDLSSRNGTRAGGITIFHALVPSGTTIQFGSTAVRVEAAEPLVATAPALRSFGGFVGSSPPMLELYALLARLARADITVLVQGETGTGKELAARALHAASRRAQAPFVVLDCTAVPASLAPSVLFGHERGAFTGAQERRVGIFEAAAGGTVFLDEIGELSAELQPMLLRVLQTREVVPVGATRPRAVDVRIVSATWRDLRAMVNQGSFREDLYYRLAQAFVRLPSLAERPDDIGELIHHTLSQLRPEAGGARSISREAVDALAMRHYPGNVRELQSTVERIAMLADGPMITDADIAFDRVLASARTQRGPQETLPPPAATPSVPTPVDALSPFKEAKQTIIHEFERAYLARLLERAGGNLSRAAAMAGLERHNLRQLLRNHGLYEPPAKG